MIRSTIALIGTLLIGLAAADDSPIYEKSSDVLIGKVFFTPQERAVLDQNRAVSHVAGADESTAAKPETDSTEKQDSAQSAGYFISGSGQSQFWRDGGFELTGKDSASISLRFPGDVTIVKHEVDAGEKVRPHQDEQDPETTEGR